MQNPVGLLVPSQPAPNHGRLTSLFIQGARVLTFPCELGASTSTDLPGLLAVRGLLAAPGFVEQSEVRFGNLQVKKSRNRWK